MKNKFLLSALLFLSSHAAFAAHAMPNACPNISEIRAVGISKLVRQGTPEKPLWIAKSKSQYGTNEEWQMILWINDAKDEDAAMVKGREIFNSISTVHGPRVSADGKTICEYKTNISEFNVIVYTPPYVK